MNTTKALVANGAPLPRDREMVAETSIRGSRGVVKRSGGGLLVDARAVVAHRRVVKILPSDDI